jgi:hypothetical protein
LQLIEPNIFYVLEATNQSALDSFILLDDVLYIFQITIKSTHNINHGLIKSANNYGFPPMDRWQLVFIIPPNHTLMVPQPWRLAMCNLSVYLAVVCANTFLLWCSIVVDPSQTWSVNKVKSIGQKVKVNN